MSALSTTVVQPLVQAKTRVANTISSSASKPSGPSKNGATPQPSPGTWQHPKLREITRRQAATVFSKKDLSIAGANATLLVLSLYLGSSLHSMLSYFASPLDSVFSSSSIATILLLLVRLYITFNVWLALRPLSPYFHKTDDISDIPLTPSQRSLLNLPPTSSVAGSPASGGYITPPRYRRSSGSFTGSTASTQTPQSGRSISANYASSPLSTSRYTLGFSPGTQSPFRSTQRTASGSPFSPSTSPLLHKAIGRGADREVQDFSASTNSFASTSGLSRSQSVKERGVRDGGDPGTPSPGGFGGVKRDPGLNYKWLYQRGGRMPKSESMNF